MMTPEIARELIAVEHDIVATGIMTPPAAKKICQAAFSEPWYPENLETLIDEGWQAAGILRLALGDILSHIPAGLDELADIDLRTQLIERARKALALLDAAAERKEKDHDVRNSSE